MHGSRKRDTKISCRKVVFLIDVTLPFYIYEHTRDYLCVHRSNASIEIWDVSHKPHIDRTLICDSSVEGLGWYNGRLFSCSANGTITEHDLHSLSPLVNVTTICNDNQSYYLYLYVFRIPVLQNCYVWIVLVHSDPQ